MFQAPKQDEQVQEKCLEKTPFPCRISKRSLKARLCSSLNPFKIICKHMTHMNKNNVRNAKLKLNALDRDLEFKFKETISK
ncbi:hypothetical protein PRUPE_5G204300 [Prunus persica]|uniref:Uncharacterized protein n=1 Tax=Prunus persica TaxID=3760 RepID=A0A251PEN3_PRUPE|nr:hypothetical protein PRUPE_5G204300 [Prunus persica]